MKHISLLVALSLTGADAALTITIRPDGADGTTYTFSQPSENPSVPVALVLSSSLRIELPPAMFDESVASGPGSGDTFGTFDMIARFEDVGSGATYDVTGLTISNTLSYAFFQFEQSFAPASGQTAVHFNFLPDSPGVLGISPDALVEGSYTIGSLLFGTVTVHVVPEVSSLALVLLGSIALIQRRRA